MRQRASSERASGLEHPVNASFHFVLSNKFAAVRLFEAFVHGGAKAGVSFKQTQSGVLDQVLDIDTGLARNFGEARFLLGGEVDFHGGSLAKSVSLAKEEGRGSAI
jgi:hypothetical protein